LTDVQFSGQQGLQHANNDVEIAEIERFFNRVLPTTAA
jgi:hypothetical protein